LLKENGQDDLYQSEFEIRL